MKHIILSVLLMFCAGPLLAQGALDQHGSVAFFGIHFTDTSTEGAYFGERPDEAERIVLLEDTVTQAFKEQGFDFMDISSVSEELARTFNPSNCYGCDVRMGEKLGATYILHGQVQKVSNLILNMNLVMRDVTSGEIVRGMSVDIRSNTDDSWLRGMRYILKNNFFKS
ncbi:hypothetical protein P775_04740 [Puniceibacterium antarcticum]|uniref:DUF2380 domain-containing protein n=1 Tax=Puniceibacterium antarcticum TaxID=1206336 RepID=A0A2G8RJN4_9RHOB|nr:DUF3280 domain-containing protein [Puniceibacterium antarcticum]PIL21298.1 hypothetical protein P775_04740 [Puniceibacterium antarcticum]